MRYISKIKKKRFFERSSFDRILQLWFNYHFFFFQSLIFRGLKLRAFSFFIFIKSGLKAHNFVSNYRLQGNDITKNTSLSFVDDKVKNILIFEDFLYNMEKDFIYNKGFIDKDTSKKVVVYSNYF